MKRLLESGRPQSWKVLVLKWFWLCFSSSQDDDSQGKNKINYSIRLFFTIYDSPFFFFFFSLQDFLSPPLVTISFTYDTFLSMIFTFCRFLLKTRNRHVSNVAHYNFYSTHSKIVVSLAYYKIAKIYEYKFSSTSACEIYFYDNLGLIIITILNMILGCPPISLLDSTQPSDGDFLYHLIFNPQQFKCFLSG